MGDFVFDIFLMLVGIGIIVVGVLDSAPEIVYGIGVNVWLFGFYGWRQNR